MKHLLSILCLFVLNCDGGGDNIISMDDLNDDWWIHSICKTYDNVCAEEDNCPVSAESDYKHGSYIKIVDGSLIDCDTEDNPECDAGDYDNQLFTIINGNTFQLCETGNIDCHIGTMELNGKFLELTNVENKEDEENCEFIVVMILERKE